MKTFLKRTCAVIGSAAMLLTCFAGVSFSAQAAITEEKDPEFIFSHIEFADTAVEGSTDKHVSAKMFARDYNLSGERVSLFCASYNADGTMKDASVDTGINALLSTAPVNIQGSDDVRAYIWNANSIEPISEIIEMNSAETVTPTITFDGKSFKDYVGSDFDPNTREYTVTLKDNYFTKSVKFPDVRAELNSKTAYAEVINKQNPFRTEINIYTGQRTETKTTWGTATETQIAVDGYTYSRPHTTYTINYTMPSGVVTAADFPITQTGADINVWNTNAGAGGNNCIARYDREITLDGAATKTETVNIAAFNRQRTIVIVKPKDGTKKDALVNSDGTPITWTDSTRLRAGKDASGVIWAKQASGTPVTSGRPALVYKETMVSDDEYINGTAACSDRDQYAGGMTIFNLAEELVGYNYITFDSGDPGVTNFNLTLTVNCDADLIFLSGGANPGAGWTSVANPPTIKDANKNNVQAWGTLRYVNNIPVWSLVAVADALGYDINDIGDLILANNSNTYKVGGKSIGGVRIGSPTWKMIYEMSAVLGSGNICYPTDADWAENHKTYDSVVAAYRKTEGFNHYSGAKMDEPAAINYPYTLHTLPFEDGERFFADRPFGNDTPQTAAAHQGLILKYSDALELENVDLFTPLMGWSNDDAFKSNYRNEDKASPWFSFTAEEDIEVLLLGKGPVKFAAAENSGWIKVNIKDDDALHVVRSLAMGTEYHANVNVHNNMFIRKYSKGEKVQIYTPQSDGYMAIAVRRLPKKAEALGGEPAPEVTVGADSVTFPDLNNGAEFPKDAENGWKRYDYVSKNFTDRTGAYAIDNTKAETPAKLGSRVIYNRVYMPNPTVAPNYTNDVSAVKDSMKFLFGSDYIMNAAGPTEKSGIEFKLYKPATIVLFEDSNPDTAKAAELGWTHEKANYDDPFVWAQIDNAHRLVNMFYKHYDVEDSSVGVKVEIPNSMIKVNGEGNAVSLAVIYYD